MLIIDHRHVISKKSPPPWPHPVTPCDNPTALLPSLLFSLPCHCPPKSEPIPLNFRQVKSRARRTDHRELSFIHDQRREWTPPEERHDEQRGGSFALSSAGGDSASSRRRRQSPVACITARLQHPPTLQCRRRVFLSFPRQLATERPSRRGRPCRGCHHHYQHHHHHHHHHLLHVTVASVSALSNCRRSHDVTWRDDTNRSVALFLRAITVVSRIIYSADGQRGGCLRA